MGAASSCLSFRYSSLMANLARHTLRLLETNFFGHARLFVSDRFGQHNGSSATPRWCIIFLKHRLAAGLRPVTLSTEIGLPITMS